MAVKTFAAIDVGSYELSMKIFEVSRAKGMREIDSIRHSIDMGTETYITGKLGYDRTDELCRILREYTEIMKGYRVEEYKAYGTSAIRETENTMILLDQIHQRTGIQIEVLSNSEQRFLDYKSIAFKGAGFEKIIEKGTAIVDIGGGSIQISLFDKDTLVTTQNMKLGVLRLQERINHLDVTINQYEMLVSELVNSQMAVFKRLYMKENAIENIIVVDDYISAIVQQKKLGRENGYADKEMLGKFLRLFQTKTLIDIAGYLDMPEDNMRLLYISALMLHNIMDAMDAEMIWAPGVTLCDGIAYEYAEKNAIIKCEHDFEKDIVACAQNISKRYRGSKRRGETLSKIALTIFDSMKKVHGLDKRDRLLLQIATILHDCGKYISLVSLGECSYSIIMATEIIGLSHTEREIVANIVKYNHLDFDYYESIGKETMLDISAYLRIAKLTSILKLANGLDRSHKQKFQNVRTTLKEGQLIITVDTAEDITLEKGLFGERADFFEEVFSVRPVIRQRRTI